MQTNNFFKSKEFMFTIFLLAAGLMIFAFSSSSKSNKEVVDPTPVTNPTQQGEVGSFAWRFEEAQTQNLDGNPNTNVFLDTTYTTAGVQSTLIATTPMGCSVLPEATEPTALNSPMAQCYGAGLGYVFKVTKGPDAYRVERKTFEEAIPDYEPPAYEYEIVAEIPFEEAVVSQPEQSQTLSINTKAQCEANAGVWYESSNVCEINSLSTEAMCTSRGGQWNDCASACRHLPEAEMCTMQCVMTCTFR